MKILIIDDDVGLRKSLSLILGDAGYDVVVAEDGEMGLGTALEQDPDLILCDVRMPKLGGIEFLDRYREAGGGALVLVMTAYGGLDLAVQAMKKGAYDYIPKPFGADEVLLSYSWPGNIRELENVLERALVLTEGPKISVEDLPEVVRRPAPDGPGIAIDGADLSVKRQGARLEKHLIQLALDRTGGNKTQAAELLDLSPRALRYKVQEYGID